MKTDEQNLMEIYDTYADGMYAYAAVLARSKDEAEDALQECFIRLLRDRESLSAVKILKPYLFAMIRNEVFRQGGRRNVAEFHEEAAGTIRLSGVFRDRIAHDEAENVRKAITRLEPGQREVVFLKVWMEMTFAEIAEILGASANTVASRYRYAMENLKKVLE